VERLANGPSVLYLRVMDRQAGLESGNPLNLILFTPSFFLSIFAFRSKICQNESRTTRIKFKFLVRKGGTVLQEAFEV